MHISLYFTVSKRKTRKNNGVKKCTSGQTKAYGILERGVSQRRLLRSQYSPDQNLQGLPIIFEIKYKHLVIIYKTLPYLVLDNISSLTLYHSLHPLTQTLPPNDPLELHIHSLSFWSKTSSFPPQYGSTSCSSFWNTLPPNLLKGHALTPAGI